MTLWNKGTAAADWVTRFTVGEDWRWDTLLLPYDAEGTRAHAWALAEIGVLTARRVGRRSTARSTRSATRRSRATSTVTVADEDCHTVIERELTARLGEAGQKIHAGRSRNDQVLVALRLWLRDALAAVAVEAAATADALLDHAEQYDDLLMPGYTHGQRAMPTTAGLWAAAFAELLADDLAGLAEARDRANVSPWGSAAGYGVPRLALPRDAVAERLGFRRPATPRPGCAALARQARSRRRPRPRPTRRHGEPARRRSRALRERRVRLRHAARRVHDRLVDHAAEAQPGRVRTGAGDVPPAHGRTAPPALAPGEPPERLPPRPPTHERIGDARRAHRARPLHRAPPHPARRPLRRRGDAQPPSLPASSPPTPRSRSSNRASRSAKPIAAPPPRSTPSPCPTRPRPSRPIVLPARRATSAPTPSAPNSTRNAHDSTRRDPGLPAYTTPYARTASATLTKPPTFAPRM